MRIRPVPKMGEVITECASCETVWPRNQMRRQYGGWVCPICYDKPTVVRRKRRIPI